MMDGGGKPDQDMPGGDMMNSSETTTMGPNADMVATTEASQPTDMMDVMEMTEPMPPTPDTEYGSSRGLIYPSHHHHVLTTRPFT